MAEIIGFKEKKVVEVPATYEIALTETECYHLMMDLLDRNKDMRPGTQNVYDILANRKMDNDGSIRSGV